MVTLSVLLLTLAMASSVVGQTEPSEAGSGWVLENRCLRLQVAAAGGRISSLVDQETGRELVALWKGPDEIGGLLDDRQRFTSARYTATRENDAEKTRLRLTTADSTGLRLEKTYELRPDERLVRVRYRFTNDSQAPARLWIRNFPLPGGPPLTEHHLYILLRRQGLLRQPFASEYYGELAAPWAALHDTVSGLGLLAVIPGVERFYFWQGSRENPTFEWLYPETPAGQVLETDLALVVVNEPLPDWSRLAENLLPGLGTPRTDRLAGWVDASNRFTLGPEAHEQGFWLSTGREQGKQPLPERLEIDLPLDGERAWYVGVNALEGADGARAWARVEGDLASWVRPAWEEESPNAIRVDSAGDSAAVTLKGGREKRLWLLISAAGRDAGIWEGSLLVDVAGHQARVPLRVQVWPVRLPEDRPFEVRGYATLGDLTGSYEVKATSLRQLDALLTVYARIGGSVLDWTVAWGALLGQIRLTETREPLSAVVAWPPGRLDLGHLPPLDFSAFDPWLEVARQHGVTRVETYLDLSTSGRWAWPCLGPEAATTGADDRVTVWLYSQLRAYLESRGARGFFCKIGDEISPEDLPAYSRAADLARRAGWRPFTTVTGLVARSAADLDRLNPDCDQWQVSLSLKDDFRQWRGADPGDEVWFYGGGSQPYRTPYEAALVYPLLAAVEGVQGYGWWAFYWWQESEKIVWYDPGSAVVRVGPTWLGLRDGWEDARFYAWVVNRERWIAPERAVGPRGEVVQLAPETWEVYRWTTITGLQSPIAVNAMRRVLLQAAAGRR